MGADGPPLPETPRAHGRSQHSHDTCKELLDLCKLPEEELPQPHIIKRKIEQARVDPDAWVRATAGSAAKAFGIKESDDFDGLGEFGHFVVKIGRVLGGGTRSDCLTR